MEFRILGPFEVLRNGESVALGGTQKRALLALLALQSGEPVSIDRLIDELWGERPPRTAAKTVQVYVSQLRKALGSGVIVTREQGYTRAVERDQVDVSHFEALCATGRRALADGDTAQAAERLASALALWRGEPLAEFAYEPFVQRVIARLAEARMAALEDRIEADLALGRQAGLISELELLVAANPLRERLRGQLMIALYRAGRQVDALAVYRRGSELLREELGLEPSRALRELERLILKQDASLDGARQVAIATRSDSIVVCPFKGLAFFDRSDAEFFFGRERLVADLVARLAESPLVGVLGPSGIGKSSLLRAGVLPALSGGVLPGSAGWRQVLLRPGEHPCAAIARAVGGEGLERVLGRLGAGSESWSPLTSWRSCSRCASARKSVRRFLRSWWRWRVTTSGARSWWCRCAQTSTATWAPIPGSRSCSAVATCWSGRWIVTSSCARSSSRRLALGLTSSVHWSMRSCPM